MSEAKNERDLDAANVAYFVSLADSRGSLSRLSILAGLNMIFLGLGLLFLYSAVYVGVEGFQPVVTISVSLIGLNLLLLLVGIIQPIVFRFQVVFSFLLAVLATITAYSLCLMAFGIGTMSEGGNFALVYSLSQYALFGIAGLLYVLGATFVHVRLLRKRLREGHSGKRTMGNYSAASSVFSSKSLWIIFGVAVIGPNLLTGGRYVSLTMGVMLFLLFASLVTSLPVEFGYLAYLKARDKRYWEEPPARRVRQKGQGWKALWKVVKWVLIVVAAFIALSLLPLIWPDS